MTGFGTGSAPLGEGRVLLEVRSLNHRFLETRVRLPSEIAEQTFYLEQRCRELLQRGRYDVSGRVEGHVLPAANFDVDRAKATYEALCRLRDAVAPDTEVPLSLLASLPDLLTRELSSDSASVRTALDDALEQAVARLDEMRSTEGEYLASDLSARLQTARGIRDTIAQSHPELAASFRKRVEDRLSRVLETYQVEVEPSRLEAEIVLLSERADVAEELTRLSMHFDQFEQLCRSEGPVGRRLDFLLQEVGREANTIGSKCQDATLAHLVVELKTELERMREQVQNVE